MPLDRPIEAFPLAQDGEVKALTPTVLVEVRDEIVECNDVGNPWLVLRVIAVEGSVVRDRGFDIGRPSERSSSVDEARGHASGVPPRGSGRPSHRRHRDVSTEETSRVIAPVRVYWALCVQSGGWRRQVL